MMFIYDLTVYDVHIWFNRIWFHAYDFPDMMFTYDTHIWFFVYAGRNRDCFRVRGFRNRVDAQNLWSHVAPEHRDDVIRSEIRARYDIIGYDSILGHANIHPDPSTGHLLQTIQML